MSRHRALCSIVIFCRIYDLWTIYCLHLWNWKHFQIVFLAFALSAFLYVLQSPMVQAPAGVLDLFSTKLEIKIFSQAWSASCLPGYRERGFLGRTLWCLEAAFTATSLFDSPHLSVDIFAVWSSFNKFIQFLWLLSSFVSWGQPRFRGGKPWVAW